MSFFFVLAFAALCLFGVLIIILAIALGVLALFVAIAERIESHAHTK